MFFPCNGDNPIQQEILNYCDLCLFPHIHYFTVAPGLENISQKDVDMYSSRSVPVATKARVNHMETLRNLQLPWWKKLGDEFQESEVPEEEILLF